jgi:hypothetical protein
MMLMLTESTLFFLNLMSNFRTKSKLSLAGHIKGWASDVAPDSTDRSASTTSKSRTVASVLSLAHGPPSSVALSATTVSTSSHGLHKITLVPATIAETTQPLTVSLGDKLLDDSGEHLDTVLPKPSAIKVRDRLLNKYLILT